MPPATGGLLQIDYESSVAETWGNLLSILTAVMVIAYVRNRFVTVLAVLCLLGIVMHSLIALHPAQAFAVDTRFEDSVDLIAASVDAINVGPGDTVNVTLFGMRGATLAKT